MPARLLNDWLSTYVKYASKTSEPPESYHWWVGVAVIAGAMQRKCYKEFGFGHLYPNLYTVLVGPSGKARKGTACEIGMSLLRQISGVKIAPESATKERLIGFFKEAITNYEDPITGVQVAHCSVTLYSEELAVFLGQGDTDFLAHLTNWYDSRDEWRYETKTQGKDRIIGVCVNLLGATAPDWLSSILPHEAVGGGFTSRVIFVVEEDRGKIVPDPTLTLEQRRWEEELLHDLEKIFLLQGEFMFEEDAMDAYQDWYVESTKNPPIHSPHFAGYCERRPVHLQKLSMIMSASRGQDHMITVADFNRARRLLEAAEVKMPRTFTGLGRARYASVTEKVLDCLMKNKVMKQSTIIRTLFPDADDYTVKVALGTLEAMKVVKCVQLSNDPTFEFVGK